MTPGPISLGAIDEQERAFGDAFRSGEIVGARDLYDEDVVYLSPTTRLFGWPRRIEGRERTLEFIQLTIDGVANIDYRLDERAVFAPHRAYTRILFDFDAGDRRLRSEYVVIYQYGQGLITGQELFYDPSDRWPEVPA
jgi:hypothetical protein